MAVLSFIVCFFDSFGTTWLQVVLTSYHLSPGLGFQLQPGALGNLSAGLRGGLVFIHAGGGGGLGNLAGGKFGEGGEDEFGLAQYGRGGSGS